MGKTEENIEHYLDPKNDKDYLQDLLLNIKEAYVNQENLTFRIVKPREKGFTVKIGGLFAYISFKHLGWRYPSIEFWRNASNYLIGSFFTGKIHKVFENPISIRVDAKEQDFGRPNLKKYAKYRGVILQKTKYGLFVDLGLHFDWKFGSILGLLYRSLLVNETDYENANEGNEIWATFQGFNKDGQVILGDDKKRGKWITGEMDELIGTVQSVTVIINENNRKEFYVQDEHKASIPVTKKSYPGFRAVVKKYISGLKHQQIIECEIIRINRRKNCYVLKLPEPHTS